MSLVTGYNQHFSWTYMKWYIIPVLLNTNLLLKFKLSK
jgi:hypothetical protein